MEFPAISVIIPVYNAEKYIAECLNSLLLQTFQNFEVIVVDDCSTDNSVAIIEKYLERFDRQQVLIKRKRNSGNFGYTARNRGFKYAKGEYVFFMDADDMLEPTAFEEFYSAAKKFNADVVYTGARYLYTDGARKELKLDKEGLTWQKKKIKEVQRLMVNEPHKLLESLLITTGVFWTPWTKFVRRQFLIEKNITFYETISGGDYIWTIELFACAKRFVRVPNAFYLWRYDSETSVSRTQKSPQIQINSWNKAFLETARALEDVFNKRDILRNNPAYCYFAKKNFFEWCFGRNLEARSKFKPEEIYGMLNRASVDGQDLDATTRFFLSFIDSQQRDIKPLKAPDESLNVGLPKISVVVPLYNMERFIGECLDSLLMQTFQDFEVIVVDDCSTDNSMEIVKNYVPKFNGRLRYSSTKENSGGAGYVSRNIGISLAHGEYICFVDADDFILLTALETLYAAAESYGADVVYFSSRYLLTKPDEIIKQSSDKKRDTEFIVDDTNKVLDLFFVKGCHHTPYQKFCRRDFLIENNIFFPEIVTNGDSLWTIHVFGCAKRFLKIPNALYFYRQNFDSATLREDLPEKQICNRMRAFLLAINSFLNLAKKINLHEKNLMHLFFFMQDAFKAYLIRTLNARSKLSKDKIFKTLYNEFYQENNSLSWVLPFFLTFIEEEQKKLTKPDKTSKSTPPTRLPLPNNAARIDIILMSETGDLLIPYISDGESFIKKATWLPNNQNGYMIQTLQGNLEIRAKATVAGKIKMSFRGMDVRDPKNGNKRVPHWIDYKKLVVNGKGIFDKLTPTWHDKPYTHNFNVNADEEIIIKAEWSPHKSSN